MSDITLFHHPACGTSRNLRALLPNPQRGAFNQEGGQAVLDAEGRRVVR